MGLAVCYDYSHGVSCDTRETRGTSFILIAALLVVRLDRRLLSLYSLEYKIELNFLVNYLFIHNYNSVSATEALQTRKKTPLLLS